MQSTFAKDLQQTSQSFCPLRERQTNTNGVTQLTQINQLMCAFAQKRSQLREAKIQYQMFKGKQNQQVARMIQVNAEFQLNLQKEEIQNQQLQRNKEAIQVIQEDINILIQDTDKLKDLCGMKYDQIKSIKNQKEGFVKQHKTIQANLREVQIKNRNIQKQNVQLQSIIDLTNTQILKVKNQIKNHLIQQNDYESQIQTNMRKVIIGQKEITAEQYKKKQISQAIRSTVDKINNCSVEIKDKEFQCSQIQLQNHDVQEINNKLKGDLDAVQNHLESLKKVNKFLNQKLDIYSKTSNRVLHVVHANQLRRNQ